MDVSNSIDQAEYRIQTEGLADALLDPDIADELVRGQSALIVIQWSGRDRQQISIPWRRMTSRADVALFAAEARAMRRAFVLSDTAVGDLIRFASAQFAPMGDCARHVIDISGDGTDNAASAPGLARRAAETKGIQINGLAIESLGLTITNFYRRIVTTRDGFVMTARGHNTYARTLRAKLRRELSQVLF